MSYFTKSKTAKIVAGVVGFTMALSLFVSFTLDLKVGSRGTEVTNLQKSLNTDSRTQVASSGAGSPGNESSYFGALTKSAVMKYQIIKGISATGMVDAATRASLNAVSASSASSVSSVASSAASSVASSVSTVGGTEGLITTKLSATPADNANVRTSTNYSAYGIEVKAIGSDMTVDRADLQVAVTVSGTAQNPSSFITGISAYDGDTLLVSKSLSSSDFNKDSS
ncbi:MAG: hypothetical protein UT80_C0033G0007, partial [Parcubacteria group bacterium GW2011_GWC1_40_13]